MAFRCSVCIKQESVESVLVIGGFFGGFLVVFDFLFGFLK